MTLSELSSLKMFFSSVCAALSDRAHVLGLLRPHMVKCLSLSRKVRRASMARSRTSGVPAVGSIRMVLLSLFSLNS